MENLWSREGGELSFHLQNTDVACFVLMETSPLFQGSHLVPHAKYQLHHRLQMRGGRHGMFTQREEGEIPKEVKDLERGPWDLGLCSPTPSGLVNLCEETLEVM